jgi:hypothetical protein
MWYIAIINMTCIFECTWARLFWQDLKSVISVNVPILHPRSWASAIVDEKLVARKEACIILCGCCVVCMERNALWHGGGGRPITKSVRWVLETTFDLA